MTGSNVVSSRFPYLSVRVQVDGIDYQGDALLDTGFSGGVILPRRLLSDSGSVEGYERWTLADNSRVVAPYYSGTVELGGSKPIRTAVTLLGTEAIVGIEIISRFYVLLDHGERVVVSQ